MTEPRRTGWLRWVPALALLNVALSLTASAERGIEWSGALAPSVVLFASLAALVLLKPGRAVLWSVAGALVSLALLQTADAAYLYFYGRPLTIATDAPALSRDALTLASGFPVRFALAVVAALCALAVAWWVVGTFFLALVGAARGQRRRRILAGLLAAGSAAGLASLAMAGPFVQAEAARTALHQIRTGHAMIAETRRIAAEVAADPLPAWNAAALASKPNVHLIFVESYASFSFFDPRSRGEMARLIEEVGHELERAGLAVASATVDSPIIGGRSWLAHATALSGTMLRNDAYLPALEASGRATLVSRLKERGYRAIAMAPALRRDWEDGRFLRFDRTYDFRDLDYRGPAYGLLEVPDQVILARTAELLLDAPEPFLLVLPLISSHWPWSVLPPTITDWNALGDGESLRDAGPALRAADAPEPPVVEGLRPLPPLYLATVGYSFRAAVQYVLNVAGENDLIVLLGDHPPAASVTLDAKERAVPVHVIARDTALIEPFVDLGFTAGLATSREASATMAALPRWIMSALERPVTVADGEVSER